MRQPPVTAKASHCLPPTWEAALHDAGVGKRLAGGLCTRTGSVGALQPLVDLALRTLARRLLDDLRQMGEWGGRTRQWARCMACSYMKLSCWNCGWRHSLPYKLRSAGPQCVLRPQRVHPPGSRGPGCRQPAWPPPAQHGWKGRESRVSGSARAAPLAVLLAGNVLPPAGCLLNNVHATACDAAAPPATPLPAAPPAPACLHPAGW